MTTCQTRCRWCLRMTSVMDNRVFRLACLGDLGRYGSWPVRLLAGMALGLYGSWPVRLPADTAPGRYGSWSVRLLAGTAPGYGRYGSWPVSTRLLKRPMCAACKYVHTRAYTCITCIHVHTGASMVETSLLRANSIYALCFILSHFVSVGIAVSAVSWIYLWRCHLPFWLHQSLMPGAMAHTIKHMKKHWHIWYISVGEGSVI